MCSECETRKMLREMGIEFVSVNYLADIMNISTRRVQQLANQGVIPKSKGGMYDYLPCIQGYLAYLREQIIMKHVEHRYEY